MRRRTALFGSKIILGVIGQNVDPRLLHVFVVAHHFAGTGGLPGKVVFPEDVTGKGNMVFSAPFADEFEVMFCKKMGGSIKKIPPHLAGIFAGTGQPQFRQTVDQTVMVTPGKMPCRTLRPRQRLPGITGLIGIHHAVDIKIGRFIGKDPRHGFAEFCLTLFAVSLVGQFQKTHGRLFVHQIRRGLTIEPGNGFCDPPDKEKFPFSGPEFAGRGKFAVPMILSDGEPGKDLIPFRVDAGIPVGIGGAEKTHLKILICRHLSPAAAGGPAVFIVQFGIHVPFAGFVDANLNHAEPFFGKVRRFQPDAAVHEEASHACSLHITDLAAQFGFFKKTVPRPEKAAPVCRRRHPPQIEKIFFHK